MDRRRRVVAILIGLVLWPGAGHVNVGRWRHGLAWWVACMAPLLLTPFWFHFLWVTLAVKLLHVIDLGFVPVYEPPNRRGWILAGGAVASLAVTSLLHATTLEAFKIPSSAMYPTLQIGDHVLVDKWYGADDVSRGDIIVFHNPCTPEKAFIKRVVALAGDTVEVRCTALHVNGVAVPRELVAAEASYWDYDDGSREWDRRPVSHWSERLGDVRYQVFEPLEAAGAPDEDSHDFPYLPQPPSPRSPPRPPNCGPDGPQLAGELVRTREDAGPCDLQLHYVVPPGTVFTMGDNRSNSSDSRIWGPVPVSLLIGRATGIWWSASPHDGVRWGRIRAL